MLFVRAAILPLAVLAAAWAADEGIPLPKESPFKPRGPGAPAATANEVVEFAGVSSVTGKKPDLIFHDKTAKKSFWIAEGETKEGISVLKYDPRRETVLVKINGNEKTLALRKGAGTVNAPTPAPAPVMHPGFNAAPAPVTPGASLPAPAPATPLPATALATVPLAAAPQPANKPEAPSTPEIQARQETEARMLVSDLLEIGMAQRKAYEEAQRRAAQGNNPPQAPAADGTQQTPPPDSQQAAKPNAN